MFDLSVIGGKDLQRKLAKIETKAQGKVMKQALKSAMKPVQELAKQRAPHVRGLLRKSIRIATRSNRRGISAMVRTGTRKQLKIPADAKYYYPAAHEYGSRFMPARSYLRSALADRKQQVLGSVSKEIRRFMETAK